MLDRRAWIDRLNGLLRPFDICIARPSDLWRITESLGKQPQGGPIAVRREPLVWTAGPADDIAQFDVTVVIPTVLRLSLARTLRSVFAQDFGGRVQTLIGIDVPRGDVSQVEAVCRERPPNHAVTLFDPGYSTSVRHGGLHPAQDGGALRCVLSYLAASPRVAYLDDDNWWAPDHLSTLLRALDGADWAWAERWFVHPDTGNTVCADTWESVGPGRGIHPGGWVDPNGLAVDKTACEAVLRWWAIPLRNSRLAMDADRNVFRILSTEFRGRASGARSVFYAINAHDTEHATRIARIGTDRFTAAGAG